MRTGLMANNPTAMMLPPTPMVAASTATPNGTSTVNEKTPYSYMGVTPSRPIIAFLLIILFLWGLRFAKDNLHKGEGRGVFHELDVSLWNVIAVSLLAIPGIVGFKFLTTRFLKQNNPLRTLVAAV